jgi:peptide/nickel transport system substrate-binding protein
MVGSGPFRFKADERVPGSVLVYEKFTGYMPRNEPAERTAGGKVVHFDRVEWRISPDMATTASALMAGELDFWTPPADLLPLLRKARYVKFETMLPAGYCAVMVFNQLHPPFDNPAIRRAVLHAVRQSDFVTAVLGEDRTNWRDDVGYFCPDTPMASRAGLDAVAGQRDVGTARKELEQAGYHGERVRLLMPTDNPKFQALAEVSADLLKKLGFNLDVQSMDWATVTIRRIKQEPLDQGGWSVFQTAPLGTDLLNPAVHPYLRTNGRRGSVGWPTSLRIEELRSAWLAAGDVAAQAKVAEQLQLQAFEDVPYVPLGQWFGPTAYRADLQGMLTGLPLFWNIKRG